MKKFYLALGLLISAVSPAAIIVRDIPDTVVSGQTTLDIDFNADNTAEYTLMDMGGSVGTNFDPTLVNFVGTGTFNSGHGWDVMKSLALNTLIGPNSLFDAQGDAYINPGWAYSNEYFLNGDSYVGTTFKIGANRYYGWILVNLNNGTVTVKSYAYNNVASQSINAGQTTLDSPTFAVNATIRLAHNPVASTFELTSTDAVQAIALYNLNGQLLHQSEGTAPISVDDWAAGQYVAVVRTASGPLTLKWIKD